MSTAHPSGGSPADPARFERAMVVFVRRFGLLRSDTTPCGQPLPPSAAHALSELAGSGPLAQLERPDRLGLAKARVSELVDQLEARGWVERRRALTDGRVRVVYLTPAGARTAEGVARARRERLTALIDTIPPARRRQVVAAIEALAEAAALPPERQPSV